MEGFGLRLPLSGGLLSDAGHLQQEHVVGEQVGG